FFIFFQAEDGIRDHCVTGVQTCALPISQIHGSRSSKGLGIAVQQAFSQLVRSEERRVGKSVDLGGRRIIKKKKKRKVLPSMGEETYGGRASVHPGVEMEG